MQRLVPASLTDTVVPEDCNLPSPQALIPVELTVCFLKLIAAF